MKKTPPAALVLKKFNFKTYENSQPKNKKETADVKLEKMIQEKQHRALKMIKDGLSERFIIHYTGLTAEQIRELNRK